MAGGTMSDGPIPGITIPVDADTSLLDAKIETSKRSMKSASELAREDADKMLGKVADMKVEVQAAVVGTKATVDKTIAEGMSALAKFRTSVASMSNFVKGMIVSTAGHVWSTVDRMLGVSKSAAGKAISFAISAMTQTIAQGYASAGVWGLTPGGQGLAMAQMALAQFNLVTQNTMMVQQLMIENNNDKVGDIILGNGLG